MDKETTRVFEGMKGMGKYATENKWPLCSERTKIEGSQALLGSHGEITVQAKAMGESFAKIAKVETLIPSLEIAEFSTVFADAPFKVNTFSNPKEPHVRYAVVVNDDLVNSVRGKLFFLSNSAEIHNMVSGEDLILKSSDISGFIESELELGPGDGSVLEITFKNDEPGINLFKEKFELTKLRVELENASRVQESRTFGMGFQNFVRRDCKEREKISKVIIPNLRNKGGPGGSILLGTLDSPDGNVYFMADGNFPKPESLVVSAVNKENKSVWLQSNNYHLPVIVPRDTEKIELIFTSDAKITSLGFWFGPAK